MLVDKKYCKISIDMNELFTRIAVFELDSIECDIKIHNFDQGSKI